MRRLRPTVAGLVGVLAVVVAADVRAARTQRPTISAALAEALQHPVGGPVVIGGLFGLGWHLVADPILRRLTVAAKGE